MKTLKIITTAIFLLISITTVYAKEKPKTIKVTYECNFDCHKCKEKVMKNIPYEKGVKQVVVDIPNKIVTISFRKDKNTIEGIKKALKNLDYEVKVKKTTELKK